MTTLGMAILIQAALIGAENQDASYSKAHRETAKTGRPLPAGEILAAEAGFATRVTWLSGDATIELGASAKADLVTAAYVLDEIAPA